MDRLQEMILTHPVAVVTIVAGAGLFVCFSILILRLRPWFPVVLLICFLLLLGGACGQPAAQKWCKRALRWGGLVTPFLMLPFYLRYANLPQNRAGALHWGCGLFLLLAWATAPFGKYPEFVRFSLMSAVSVTILLAGSLGTVWYFASTPRRLVALVDVLHRLAFVVLALGLAFMAVPGVRSFAAGRFKGFFNNANWNGILAALLLPVAFWKLRYPRSRLEQRLTTILIAALATNVMLSGSRGAILGGTAAGLLAVLRLVSAAKIKRYAVLMALIASLVVISEFGRGCIETQFLRVARLPRVSTLTHRTEMWSRAWPSIRENFLLGIGLGNSRYILLTEAQAREQATHIGGYGEHLHSQHVLMLAEMGILGLLFLWVLMVAVVGVSVRVAQCRRTPMSDLVFALFCSCLVVFADSFIHGWMLSAGSPFALLFWTMLAMWMKAIRFAGAETKGPVPGTADDARRDQYALRHSG